MPNRQTLGSRLVLALEQTLLRDTLAAALHDMGFEVLVADPRDLSSVHASKPGCTLVLDAEGPDQLNELSHLLPEAHVLFVSADMDEEMVDEVLARGRSGVVGHDASLDEIRAVIVAVTEGATVVHGVSRCQLGDRPAPITRGRAQWHLTARETSVLAVLARGGSTREVAEELGMTTNTARTHIQRILRKMGLHSRLEAASAAARAGVI